MVKFYIVQTVADSESCIILKKLEEAKILNLSKKKAKFQQLNNQLLVGSKISTYDPHTEKNFDGINHKIYPKGASGTLPKLKFHKMRLGAVFCPYI